MQVVCAMSAPQPQGKPAAGHGRPPQHKVVPSEWKIELPKAGCVDDRMFGGCRSIEVGYKKEGMVGEGTYGEVRLPGLMDTCRWLPIVVCEPRWTGARYFGCSRWSGAAWDSKPRALAPIRAQLLAGACYVCSFGKPRPVWFFAVWPKVSLRAWTGASLACLRSACRCSRPTTAPGAT